MRSLMWPYACRYLCVTSNYKAREHGVTKLMSVRGMLEVTVQLAGQTVPHAINISDCILAMPRRCSRLLPSARADIR